MTIKVIGTVGFGSSGGSAGVSSFNTRTGVVTLTQSDVTNALGYTPVAITGSTMTGPLLLNADPSDSLGAATKQYVDNVASGSSLLSTNNTWIAAQRGYVTALTASATITPNFNASNNFSLTPNQSFTLANPSGTIVPGQSGIIAITQDSGGFRAISSWGSYWKAVGGSKPVLSTAGNTTDLLSYYVVSSTSIFVSANLGIS